MSTSYDISISQAINIPNGYSEELKLICKFGTVYKNYMFNIR